MPLVQLPTFAADSREPMRKVLYKATGEASTAGSMSKTETHRRSSSAAFEKDSGLDSKTARMQVRHLVSVVNMIVSYSCVKTGTVITSVVSARDTVRASKKVLKIGRGEKIDNPA